MNYSELMEFREQVAEPRLQSLLDATVIPEGVCCIDCLEIGFLDGRSCGVDYHILASGLICHNGQIERYNFDEYDVSVSEFVDVHKDCVFISEGVLCLEDEVSEFEVHTKIRNMSMFVSILPPEYEQTKGLDVKNDFLPYVKMERLFEPSVDELIASATQACEEVNKDVVNKSNIELGKE